MGTRRAISRAVGSLLTAALVAVTLLVAAPAMLPTPANAQPAAAEVSSLARFELSAIDAVMSAEDAEASITTSVVIAAGEEDRDDLRLVTTVYTRVEDAGELAGVFSGNLPSVFSSTASDLTALSAGSTRVTTTETRAADLALVGPDAGGVYPLQLQAFHRGESVGSITTAIIVVPDRAPQPLPTTVLVPLYTRAAPAFDGVPSAAFERLLAPDAPLVAASRQLESLLQSGTAAGFVLAADGRLLSDLATVSDGFVRSDQTAVESTSRLARRAAAALESVRDVARRGDTEMVAYPYGPADLVALVRADLTPAAIASVVQGPASAALRTDAEVTSDILLPPAGLDADTLAALGQVNASAMVIDRPYITYADSSALEPVRRLRTADGGEVRVLTPHQGLSNLLAYPSAEGPVATMQRFRAETAIRSLSGGPLRDSRGVFISIDPQSPRAVSLADVRTAIASSPWLRPVSLSTMIRTVSPSSSLARLSYPDRAQAAELPSGYLDLYRQAGAALGPIGRILPTDDLTPAQFRDLLSPMAAIAYRQATSRPEGLRRGSVVINRLAELSAAIEIADSAPITFTSATGEVPVTVTNTSDTALRVRVRVEGSRFGFPAGDFQDVTLDPRSSRQLEFLAESLNPGGFAPMSVVATDPQGAVELAAVSLSIRSTAIPIVGLVATIGSVGVLLLWAVRQGQRRRPSRRAAATPSDTPSNEDAA